MYTISAIGQDSHRFTNLSSEENHSDSLRPLLLGGVEFPKEKWEWMSDLVQIILFYEIYKRRHGNRNGILKF